MAESIPLAMGDAGLSFVNYDRKSNMLWTGNFYYFWDKDYNSKAYKGYNTLLMGYSLTDETENGFRDSKKAWSTSSYDYVPDAVCDLNDYDRVQGIAFTDNQLILSQSFGRGNKSTLYFLRYPRPHQADKSLTIDGIYVPVCEMKEEDKIKTFPMSEGLDVRNNKLYTVYESAAEKYLDGGKDKTDYVWGYRLDGYKGENYPVIVLPGIMGSTLKGAGGVLGVPVLTGNSKFIPQSDLVIADTTAAATGADDLISTIEESGGYKVYPCPYDWRLSIGDISDKYLEPLINKAKAETGSDKVILVAHSMGGLVARDYIQSSGYNYDVDSLYMIGTPNEGSTAMIPLSEFGVPYDAAQATVMAYNYNTSQAVFDYEIEDDGRTVTFTDMSTGEISSWEWDFDSDGTVDSTEQNPTYIYENDGVYDVTLIVSGPSGRSVFTCDDAVKIGVYPVELVAEAETDSIKPGESIALSAYILMSDESQVPADDIVYTSSDETVLSINENVLTANKTGSAVITASAGGMTGSIELSVVAEEVSVTLIADGYGFADGGGNYQLGETALVSAVPLDNIEFLGWYIGDELVSDDLDYEFEVVGAVELKAVFGKGEVRYVSANLDYCKYDGENITARIDYNYIFDDCIVYLAIYDENGRLVSIASRKAVKDSESSEIIMPETDLTGYSFKVFFWRDINLPAGNILNGIIE